MDDAEGAEPLLGGEEWTQKLFDKEPAMRWLPRENQLPKPFSTCLRLIHHRLPYLPDVHHPKVCELIHERAPMTTIAGPAVVNAQKGALLIWTVWLIAPFVAFHGANACNTDGRLNVDVSKLVQAFFLSLLVLSAYFESQALKYVLPQQVIQTKEFTALGGYINFTKLGFLSWYIPINLLSLASKLSIMSNSVLLARVWKINECEEANNFIPSRLQVLWGRLHFGPVGLVPFQYVVAVTWCLMVLQPLFAVIWTIPIGEMDKPDPEKEITKDESWRRRFKSLGKFFTCSTRQTNFSYELPPDNKPKTRKSEQYVFQYYTVMDPCCNNGSAAMITAGAARMASVTFQDFNYAFSRMDDHRENVKKMLEDETNLDKKKLISAKFAFMHLARHQLANGIALFFLKGILENALFFLWNGFLLGAIDAVDRKDQPFAIIAPFLNVVMMGEKAFLGKQIFRLKEKFDDATKGQDETRETRGREVRLKESETRGPMAPELDDKRLIQEKLIIMGMFKRFYIYVWIFRFLWFLAAGSLLAFTFCPCYLGGVWGCLEPVYPGTCIANHTR